MAEKRVSVRLAAQGGDKVKADLRGIGDAGADGMGRVSRETDLAAERLTGFAKVAGAALAAAAAAAAAAAGAIFRNVAQNADAIGRLSAVANATPEAFQRMAAAAATVGVEQEALSSILKDVTERVGDFVANGGGPMADFFENIAPKVGVTADQFARLSGPEALQLYVDSLEKAGVSQQEMTFYLEAMASDTTALLPLLRDGGAEIERLGDQAQRLGAVLSDEALAGFEDLDAAMVRVETASQGLANQLAVAMAPAVTAVVEAVADFAERLPPLTDMIEALGVAALGLAATRLPAVIASLATLTTGANLAAAATGALRIALALLGGPIGVALGVATALAGAFLLMRDRGDEVDDTLRFVKEAQDSLNGAMATFFETAAPKSAAEAVRYANDLRRQALAARDAAASQLALARANLEVAKSRMESMGGIHNQPGALDAMVAARTAQIAEFEEGLARAQGALVEAGLTADRTVKDITGAMAERMTAAAEALKLTVDVIVPGAGGGAGGVKMPTVATPGADPQQPARWIEPVNDELRETTAILDSVQGSFKGMFSAVLTGSKSAGDAVRDLGLQLVSMASNRAFDAVLGAAFGALGAAIRGPAAPAGGGFVPFGIYHSGGVVGAPGGVTRNLPAGLLAGAPRYHAGGMAGLRPDEVPAILQRGETVTPRGQRPGGGGAVDVRVYVDQGGNWQAEVERLSGGVAGRVYAAREGGTVRRAVQATYAAAEEVRI